jgi:hypothetical protein
MCDITFLLPCRSWQYHYAYLEEYVNGTWRSLPDWEGMAGNSSSDGSSTALARPGRGPGGGAGGGADPGSYLIREPQTFLLPPFSECPRLSSQHPALSMIWAIRCCTIGSLVARC